MDTETKKFRAVWKNSPNGYYTVTRVDKVEMTDSAKRVMFYLLSLWNAGISYVYSSTVCYNTETSEHQLKLAIVELEMIGVVCFEANKKGGYKFIFDEEKVNLILGFKLF